MKAKDPGLLIIVQVKASLSHEKLAAITKYVDQSSENDYLLPYLILIIIMSYISVQH